MDRESVEDLSANRKFLDGSRICREAIETKSRNLDGSRLQ